MDLEGVDLLVEDMARKKVRVVRDGLGGQGWIGWPWVDWIAKDGRGV